MEILKLHGRGAAPPNSHRVWLGLVLLFALAGISAAAEPAAAAKPALASVPEYNAKAGYLLLFTRYVEWPAGTFATTDDPIVIGVLGANPFGDVLERTVSNLKSQGRPLEIRYVTKAEEAGHCQVIFIARNQERLAAEWLRALQGKPILTVTDSAVGLAQGAVIALSLEKNLRGENKVLFYASLPPARAAGLQISASMLASARKVYRDSAEIKEGP